MGNLLAAFTERMASLYQRRSTWWVQFYHPRTRKLVRESLCTSDKARAELLRQRIELEATLLEPRFRAADIPEPVRKALGAPVIAQDTSGQGEIPVAAPAAAAPPTALPARRVPMDEALGSYIDFIRAENAFDHVGNKLSILRRFLGTERVEPFVQADNQKLKERRLKTPSKAFFTGEFLDEITPALLQAFFKQLDVSKKTKRHYREFFHHFFEFCIKSGLYRPENWHCPNPVAALPTYLEKNRRIVYLTPEDVEAQLKVLQPHPDLHIAAAVMIYAGLRRAEALWLTRDAFAPDLSFLSVVNRVDEETDIESSLKTGERAVTILPPLRRLLETCLPTLRRRWLVPSPRGGPWNGDAFAKKLRKVNGKAGLPWTCLHFRHAYATQRAAQGWSLLRIATELGNSVAVVAEYYAAYMRPVEIGAPEAAPELRVVRGGVA